MFLATRYVETTRGSFVLIVDGRERARERQIVGAYRLYAEPEEAARLAEEPSAAFATFLGRYGIRFLAHERRSLFLPALILEHDRTTVAGAVMAEVMRRLGVQLIEGRALRFGADLMLTEDAIRLAWPFIVNTTAYLTDVPR